MSVRAVEGVILDIRDTVEEWNRAELGRWREVDTRLFFVDPVIRALGWNTADPKECRPEYFRGGGAVDYALFAVPDLEGIGQFAVTPELIIECKPLGTTLDLHVPQLRGYVTAAPRMWEGVAVLTDGWEWWIYDVSLEGRFASKRVEQVDILSGSRRASARLLNEWLGK